MAAPRNPKPTIDFINVYCDFYRDLFSEVGSFESFKILHFGMLSSPKRKSLPEIAKLAGLENSQSLHHFLTESPWEAAALMQRRLERILVVLVGRPITLIIDETGDAKAEHKTDDVKRQYLGNLGKVENGIVAVTAYGVIADLTFLLTFRLYKPRERLKAGDEYQSKPEMMAAMIRELQALGFKIDLVLADSLYGESHSNFMSILEELKLNYFVAIWSNHNVWLPRSTKVRARG